MQSNSPTVPGLARNARLPSPAIPRITPRTVILLCANHHINADTKVSTGVSLKFLSQQKAGRDIGVIILNGTRHKVPQARRSFLKIGAKKDGRRIRKFLFLPLMQNSPTKFTAKVDRNGAYRKRCMTRARLIWVTTLTTNALQVQIVIESRVRSTSSVVGKGTVCFKGLQKLQSLQSNTTAQCIPAKFLRGVVKMHDTRNLDNVITFIDIYHSEPSLCTCTNPCKRVTVVVTINNESEKGLTQSSLS
uniref:Uncharacterized protein n=1 Tax=Rhipicephalus zambeziensis TaxID=60191 RepID=A0A224YG16_9ACAR